MINRTDPVIQNIFTPNIILTPATCKGTHIFRLEFLFLSS